MLLYHVAKLLMYVLAAVSGILFSFGKNQPQSMAVAFFLIPICLLLYWVQKRLWIWANQRMPLICVEAIAVRHRQVFSGGRGVKSYRASFLTFEMEHGEQIEFEVTRETYERIQIGAKGLLEYRGKLYESFRKPVNEYQVIVNE